MDDDRDEPNADSRGPRDDVSADTTRTSGSPAIDEETIEETRAASTPGSRDVVVPLRLYKTITVFSTLLAVATILAGFVVLDRATRRASLAPEDVNLLLALAGLGLLAFGTVVYAFSTRFRTEGMGKPKDDTDEEFDNG